MEWEKNLHKWEEIFQHTGIAKVFVNTKTHSLLMTRGPAHDILFTLSSPSPLKQVKPPN